MKIITLQRNAQCKGCGKVLPAGSRARYYAQDKIYCEEPHNTPQRILVAQPADVDAPVDYYPSQPISDATEGPRPDADTVAPLSDALVTLTHAITQLVGVTHDLVDRLALIWQITELGKEVKLRESKEVDTTRNEPKPRATRAAKIQD